MKKILMIGLLLLSTSLLRADTVNYTVSITTISENVATATVITETITATSTSTIINTIKPFYLTEKKTEEQDRINRATATQATLENSKILPQAWIDAINALIQ